MLANLAKSRTFLIAVAILPPLLAGLMAIRRGQPLALTRSGSQSGGEDAVSRMRDMLSKERSLLAGYEQEQAKLRAEVISRRKLFQDGQIAKEQVQDAEQAFVAALKRVHETRQSVIETDIAITEAVSGQKVERLPVLPLNGYSETKNLARFNGGFKWSLSEAPRLEKYFSQTFGRRLPITALGQSETHNRLHFDHRNSMDVALHPDSVEGKALIEHLRKDGIPFIAFRGPVAGASTGAHIHIGKPSGRLAP
jgi:hypothetical protein